MPITYNNGRDGKLFTGNGHGLVLIMHILRLAEVDLSDCHSGVPCLALGHSGYSFAGCQS